MKGKKHGSPQIFDPCGLGVRALRTHSPHGADCQGGRRACQDTVYKKKSKINSRTSDFR